MGVARCVAGNAAGHRYRAGHQWAHAPAVPISGISALCGQGECESGEQLCLCGVVTAVGS
ncbi:hypothetical protein BGLA2_390027 [Burkholderia gladioli]|nr:hypothetical protein BGLA2_390027 [Burkholderia gladioli]